MVYGVLAVLLLMAACLASWRADPQKIARRIALCIVLPYAIISNAASRLVHEPRDAWRLIRMDLRIQLHFAKEAWMRWWEF
jgi:hypothetical protein